jgi:carbonic anhydrase
MSTHQKLAALGLSLMTFCAALGGCAAAPAGAAPRSTTHASEATNATSAQAKKLLIEGNARFAEGRTQHPRQNPERRAELSGSQHPIAVIVGCADSRTGPEILFDQGLGDLFVVRQAGNVVDDHALGSIEYAVEHLHTPLVVVLGHERCGAVSAARDTVAANAHADGHIESLVASIRPAVEATVGQDAEATCRANVRNVVKALRSSQPILRHMAEEGTIEIVGAYYDLDTGTVTFLSD